MAAMMESIHGDRGRHAGSIDRDIELFRRILESLARQPVEVNLEQDHLGGGYGGRMARVYFRDWCVYSMVDTQQFRYGYGEAGVEVLAKATYEQAVQYADKAANGRMRDAYQSMASYEPEWGKQGGLAGAAAPPQSDRSLMEHTPEEHRKEAARLNKRAAEGSFENPLRVELQKKVDAWLK